MTPNYLVGVYEIFLLSSDIGLNNLIKGKPSNTSRQEEMASNSKPEKNGDLI